MNNFLRSVISKTIFVYCLTFFIVLQKQDNIVAQIKFSAVSSGREIGKNEYLHLQYIVENAATVTRITPPSFKNFSIISGPNQQSGMSIINGTVKQYVAISFVLKPLTAGNFTIAAAIAKAEGKEFRSNMVKVTVSNSKAGSSAGGSSIPSPLPNLALDHLGEHEVREYDDYILRKGENLQEKISKNIFVKAEVTKTSCYVGEPIIATYKLFTRLKSESNLTKSPSFNGFSVSDLDKPDNYSLHTEKLNGREYNVYILRKVQLYPLQPGMVELEPAEVENRITFIKAEYADARKGDMFYDMLRDFADAATPQAGIEAQKITLQSKPVSIEVKPLPENNKPAQFKGAVGDFKIDAVVDKTNITSEDVNNLKIIVSGTGNIQMVNSPDIVWPEGLEAFESESSEKIDNMAVPMKGTKIFTYPFTALKPLEYSLPSVAFSFFDINTKSYKIVSTKPITITVKKAKGRRLINAINRVYNKMPDTFTDRIYQIRWFLISGAVATAILLFWLFKNRRKEKVQVKLKNESNDYNNHEKNAPAIRLIFPEDPLKLPRERLEQNNSRLFYSSLDHSLRKYLSARLNFPAEEFGKKKIKELLDKSHVAIGTILLLNSLLEDIELNLYAPVSSADQMQDIYSKASEVITSLDRQVV